MYWRSLVRKRVLVSLLSGAAVSGVLLKRSGPLLVIVDASVIPAQGDASSADGQIVVERSQVEFIQVLG